MGLAVLILGLVVFLGVHVFTTLRDQRAELIERHRSGPTKGSIRSSSLIGFVSDHGRVRAIPCDRLDRRLESAVLDTPVAVVLVWPAFICVIAAYIRGDIARVLKHPMLVGVKLWAVAHLIANGDLGSIILFGSVLAWAVYDRISLKHRSDPGAPPIPYGGRQNDIIAVVVGTIIYLAFGLVFHPLWIGVPVFGNGVDSRPSLRIGAEDVDSGQTRRRLTAPDIRARKGGAPIVSLTSYHAHTAALLDKHCDLILVGDSLGMVMHGLETTIPVTLDMMILQGRAVMRGSSRALVVVDMPFGSYEASREQAFMSAARVMKETGCGAIKLEGGRAWPTRSHFWSSAAFR